MWIFFFLEPLIRKMKYLSFKLRIEENAWICSIDNLRQARCFSTLPFFPTVDVWRKRWWSRVPKSNESLQKSTGDFHNLRWLSSHSCFPRTVSTRRPARSLCRFCWAVFLFSLVEPVWCPAEVARPSPTGLALAACRGPAGGLCTYPSWRVRNNNNDRRKLVFWKCFGKITLINIRSSFHRCIELL